MPYYDWQHNLSTDPNWQSERGNEVTIIDLATGQTIEDVVRCDSDDGMVVRLARIDGKYVENASGDGVLSIVDHRPFRISFTNRMPPETFETPPADLLSKISGQVICGAAF